MFLSSYENKIDKKGRVSVPATFRSYLSTKKNDGFVAYPSFNHAALEGCTKDRIEKLKSEKIDSSVVNELINFITQKGNRSYCLPEEL